MNRQEIIDSWNAEADEYNQWNDLGEDEKLEWAMHMEREACAKVCEEMYRRDGFAAVECEAADECAAAIRARGQK